MFILSNDLYSYVNTRKFKNRFPTQKNTVIFAAVCIFKMNLLEQSKANHQQTNIADHVHHNDYNLTLLADFRKT